MNDIFERMKIENELEVITQPVELDLEMAHIAYAEVKKTGGGKALLFTAPTRNGKQYDMPVLMNLYGSKKRVEMIFGCDVEKVADRVKKLIAPAMPKTLWQKISKIYELLSLKYILPKRVVKRGLCQAKIYLDTEATLDKLPILKTWSLDAAPFITMGQVYTQSLDGQQYNLGMYRLQVYDDKTLGLHWQIHKDSSAFFDEYEAKNIPMPVSIAIGGDPLYTWCATAPLPKGIFELLLYGFIRKKNAQLIKCKTNDLFVPDDADIVIEGWVQNPKERRDEGAFGDHTGFYTPVEPYPFMTVTAITTAMKPIFMATVVGKPPIEDKYMGYPTERIFLPLFKTSVPDLIDYRMPENGVFHNLIIAKIKSRYSAHAQQAMHAFWGVGQMSFVKHAFFVNSDAPELANYPELLTYCLDRFDTAKTLISNGILDALDHSSNMPLQGGKLAVDFTGEKVAKTKTVLSDQLLTEKVKQFAPETIELKQYCTDTANPITLIKIHKTESALKLYDKLKTISDHLSIVFVLDDHNNDIYNPYMSIWRITNNIDAVRDVILGDFVLCDATNKNAADGYNRAWPKDTDCDRKVIETLRKKGLWNYDENFAKTHQLY